MKKQIKVKFIINGINETGEYEFATKKAIKEFYNAQNKNGCSTYKFTEIIYL